MPAGMVPELILTDGLVSARICTEHERLPAVVREITRERERSLHAAANGDWRIVIGDQQSSFGRCAICRKAIVTQMHRLMPRLELTRFRGHFPM